MKRRNAACLAALALSLGAKVHAAPPSAADAAGQAWARMTAIDVGALADELRASHPGVADPENPGVRAWMTTGLMQALSMAQRSRSLAGDEFALRFFAAGFNDDHVILYPKFTAGPARYPGAVVAQRDGVYRIVESEDAALPVGAEVLDCDGRTPQALFRDQVAPFYPIQGIEANRTGFAPYIFADFGNPYVTLASHCRLKSAGATSEAALTWRNIDRTTLIDRMRLAAHGAATETGLVEWRPGHFWIGLPMFDVTSDSAAVGSNYATLEAMIAQIKDRAEALRSAQVIVFDVRGNHGGSSEPGDRMLQAIWGADATDNLATRSYQQVEWRTSPGNIAAMNKYLDTFRRLQGADAKLPRQFEKVIAAMEAGRAKGVELVAVEKGENGDRRPEVKPKIILLSNGTCISACMDFADAVLSIKGAEVWGADTGADTIYIENRGFDMPSGLFRLSEPMKLWRGRHRGSNQPYKATRRYAVPLATTAEARAWVDRGLAAGDAR